jgi:hypothetical protein
LATEVASVQPTGEPVLNTDEVRPTDGVDPIVETVDAPTPMIEDQAPKEVARDHTDTERETFDEHGGHDRRSGESANRANYSFDA